MRDYVMEILLRRCGAREWRTAIKKSSKAIDLSHRVEQPDTSIRREPSETRVENWVRWHGGRY